MSLAFFCHLCHTEMLTLDCQVLDRSSPVAPIKRVEVKTGAFGWAYEVCMHQHRDCTLWSGASLPVYLPSTIEGHGSIYLEHDRSIPISPLCLGMFECTPSLMIQSASFSVELAVLEWAVALKFDGGVIVTH